MSGADRPPSSPRDGARIPPHNLDAEASVLGAMLLSTDAVGLVSETGLAPGDFYRPAHQHIFDAIRALYTTGEPIDTVTVADALRRGSLLEEAGGAEALHELQNSTPAISSAPHYAKIVQDTAILRRLIRAASDVTELAYSGPDDVTKAVDQAESTVFEVGESRVADTTRPIRDLIDQTMDRLEQAYERGNTITGAPTGYHDLDELLSGLQPSTLNIVGARPAMGKTAMGLGIAVNVAKATHTPVLVFSLEMGHDELTQRIVSSEARVDSSKLRTGRLSESDWGKIGHAIGRLEVPLFLDDNAQLTVMEIRAKARRIKARHGSLGLVVIDYLQLMSSTGRVENRQLEISEISRSLKVLARELETPVVALSQLSRNLEARSDKRPMLSDLRESGCMPASTRLLRADTGEEVTLGELVLSQQQPLVWSIDDRWRLVPKRLLRAFPSGIKPVFRLRLASGLEVDATANHPFLTVDGWRRLDELAAGNFIAVPRRVPVPVHAQATWTDDELVLLAHLLGDGSIGPNGVKYATADDANKEAVEGAASRLFGIEVSGRRQRSTWLLWLPSPYRLTHGRRHPVRNWLEPYGLWGSRSHDKFVPSEILGLPHEQVALFLHHLWATDGSITVRRNRRGHFVVAYYASTSRRLIEDVQKLLWRLDIRTRIRRARKDGYRDSWHLHVSGRDDLCRFLQVVGCHGQRGERIDEALRVLADVKPNPNVDLVPWEVANRVKESAAANGVTHRELAENLGEWYCGSYLLGTPSRPRRFSRDRLRRIGEILDDPTLVDLATSDVLWDEIVEVVALGDQPTFDATVEDTHNFIADGVIAHNSLEQDADVVMFLYRDEVYNPESPDKGSAEVIVAKHRSGPIGTKRLVWLDQYTRFENAARPSQQM